MSPAKILFITLTIVTVLSQVPHVYFTFKSFTKLESKWLIELQAILFCGILSTAIFAFVLIGRNDLALFGAVVEIIINVYYYSLHFWTRRGNRFDTRKNWIAIFFGVLLPVLILLFSHILVTL